MNETALLIVAFAAYARSGGANPKAALRIANEVVAEMGVTTFSDSWEAVALLEIDRRLSEGLTEL